MIFDRDIDKYIIHIDSPLSLAIQKISQVKGRVLFGVDEHNHLVGVLTNGDLIRWISRFSKEVDLEVSLSEILNYDFSFVREHTHLRKSEELLKNFLFVPVVDKNNHLVAVARNRTKKDKVIHIGSREISADSPVYVIAEIGNNHNGDLTRAYRLIDAAVQVGADCAKFQMRDIAALYVNAGNSNDARENLGSQYTLDLLNRFQLKVDELFLAFDYCKEKGITPLCTPWDIPSAKLLEEFGMPAYKVASADLTNHELIEFLINTGKPLIFSTGMSTEIEIKQTVDLARLKGAQYALLHCNSCYPPPYKDLNLNYINRLKEIGSTVVGYSGHERDIFVAVAAVACGARIIEKHLTEDISLEGSDHKISLLPYEFSRMVDGIRQVDSALGNSDERQVSQGEDMNRATLAKSIFINQSIDEGDTIHADMLSIKSPGQGLQPNLKGELIGRLSKRKMEKGDAFYLSDLSEKTIFARDFSFRREWGLPVRFHDYKLLMSKTNLSLLEFHLSYKDMEVNLNDYFGNVLNLDLIVHSPELFAGDHVLDLCSPDEECRRKSVFELQKVIDFTRKLGFFFEKDSPIGIITNVGGFSEARPLGEEEKMSRLQYLKESLDSLDTNGVEIWPQTMPPFPWHFGGQRHHNIFVDADEIVEFCSKNNYKVCLDVSHTKLAVNNMGGALMEFVQKISPYISHLHLADAKGVDDEGLQIGDGEIDFLSLAKVLDDSSSNASLIPEIWQGHENHGEGFWLALDRLEKYF